MELFIGYYNTSSFPLDVRLALFRFDDDSVSPTSLQNALKTSSGSPTWSGTSCSTPSRFPVSKRSSESKKVVKL